MGVDVSLWRARIGLFFQLVKPKSYTAVLTVESGSVSLCIRILLFMLLTMQCVELNPGPRPDHNPATESGHIGRGRGGVSLNSGGTSLPRGRGRGRGHNNMPFEGRGLQSNSPSDIPKMAHHNVSNISFGATVPPHVDTRRGILSAMSGLSCTEGNQDTGIFVMCNA